MLSLGACSHSSVTIPDDDYNLSPSSRTLAPGSTSALTNYVAGIGPELSSTVPFHVIPHPGDLTQVSATISLPEGTVSTSWKYVQNGSSFRETITAPESVAGRYGIRTGGKPITISIDGQVVWSTCRGNEVPSSLNLANVFWRATMST
jgi:hypothetical protein